MGQTIHILKQSGQMDDTFVMSIKKSIRFALKKAQKVVQIPPLDIVVMDDPKFVIPELGISGYAKNSTTIFVHVDPNSSHLINNLEQEVVSTIAHELHHVLRMSTVGYGKTLLEALITEGLADHFDKELNQTSPKPWSISLKPDELGFFSRLAINEYNNTSYNHQDWFFGSLERRIPRWAGYAIGFDLVGKYIKRTDIKASQLFSTLASEFIS